MALQLRRGTNAQRLAVTPLDGELIVVTDYAAEDVSPLWLGDGATVGGIVPITLELDDLTDVVIAELADLQILQYNGLTQQWNNVSNPVLTGLTAGNITVGLTDNNAITTTTGNLAIDSAGGTTTINDNVIITGDVAVNGGDVTTSSGTGNLFNANATTVNIGNGATTEVNLGAPGAGRVQIKSPQLDVNGSATITGNLTVNGTTTTINTDTLDVEDKNITLAKVATPSDAIANGGGITLKGTTDKTINWYDADDRWYFNNGDGVERPMVVTLDDLGNVQTTPFSDGEFLVARTLSPGNVQFINSSLVEFTSTTARPKFVTAATGGTISAEFLRRVSTPADGDTSGVFFGNIDGANAKLFTHRISSIYNTAGDNAFRIQTDSVGNFGVNTTTIQTTLNLTETTLSIKGNELVFNAANTGPTQNAAIRVERGSSADATITWDETNDLWNFAQPVFATGGFIGSDYIGTNGNEIYFNNDDGGSGATSSIIVKRGANADVVLRWNETSDRWESTTNGSTYVELPNQDLDTDSNPSFAGLAGGFVRIGIASDNEIDTSSGNLTIDSAGGTTTVDDNLVVSGTNTFTVGTGTATFNGDLTHNGAAATFNNGLSANNVRIATSEDNTISTSTGALTLTSATAATNVTGTLTSSGTITATNGIVVAGKISMVADGISIQHSNVTDTGTVIRGMNVITTTSTTPTDMNLGIISQSFASIDFTLQARRGDEWQVVKGMLLIDSVNNNTFLNIYSDLRTGAADLFTVSANIDGTNAVDLLVTSTSATSTKYSGHWIGQRTPN
jgi:hypothetical protein